MATATLEAIPPVAGPRKTNVGDVMILIIALAVGLALALRPLSDIGEWHSRISPTMRGNLALWWIAFARKSGPQFLVVQGCVQLFYCFLIPLTPALLAIRLRRPRPAMLACQPGFASSVALCVAAVAIIELSIYDLVILPPKLGMALPGLAVLAAWSILAVTHRWRPEAGWIDRSGRLVGAFWLATVPWSIWVAS